MADVYMYADETGDLDMRSSFGASRYFGIGTAVLPDGHGDRLWEGLKLRCHLEGRGVRLPRGFHAKNDSRATRAEVFTVIQRLRPRFDTTFLLKARASKSVIKRGQVDLYRTACYLHVKRVADLVTRPGDRLFVIVGSLQTHNKRDAMRHALQDACSSIGGRTIVLCIWDAPSSWGLQIADYGLWATHRVLEGRDCPWFATCVGPTLRSIRAPWGRA
jgi:uncharacterized protein DUF3800